MMKLAKTLRIVRPAGYPALFNTPRKSRHDIRTRYWLPLHKINHKLETPLILASMRRDPVAAFNRIPLGTRSFVITFESHLPRLFDYPNGIVNAFFVRQLISPRCRGIIPFSEFAKRTFLQQHKDSIYLESLRNKLLPVFYPALPIPDRTIRRERSGKNFKVIFIGSHFIRKGGLALLRAAELAHQAGLPVEFHVISKMTMGRNAGVWTDPVDMSSLAEELRSLSLPNVIMHGQMENRKVIELLNDVDLKALPTISDTFGYSIIEAFANSVPVVATNTCSIPEIVTDRSNGILLSADTNEFGEWKHLFSYQNEGEDEYVGRLRNAERLKGDELFKWIDHLRGNPAVLDEMADAAYQTASTKFNSAIRDVEFDELYCRIFP